LGPIQPVILWVPGVATSPGVKWPMREAHHPSPSSVGARNFGTIGQIPTRRRVVVLA
jgi:hypothetical protein